MTLWIIFAVMTAAAVLAVLWPLGRQPQAPSGGSDRFIYQDQLLEIDRDRTAGLIGESEAKSARVEISRRLLAAAAAEPQGAAASLPSTRPVRYRITAAVMAIVILPTVAVSFYLKLGSPDIPGQSALARGDAARGARSITRLVAQVETRLTRNPNDGAGWEVVAPVYLRLGRFDDAVAAWRKAIALNGETPKRFSDLGEALVAAANGIMTEEAKTAFQRAVSGDPSDAKARYFLGLADAQDGNREAAAAKWRAMLAGAPNSPWANFVRAALAKVTGEAESADIGSDAGDAVAVQNTDEAQRTAMIRGMVEQLADRLRADGDDVDGWLRLVRAYVVLGDRDKAKNAAADARRALQSRPADIDKVDGLVKGLGLEG
jgi:cytochrome c-type biogenesis protein CcmH